VSFGIPAGIRNRIEDIIGKGSRIDGLMLLSLLEAGVRIVLGVDLFLRRSLPMRRDSQSLGVRVTRLLPASSLLRV
jgi:hypothetical protein